MGLLVDRLTKARERLEEAREAVRALCDPVEPPKGTAAYLRYFCAKESGNAEELKANEPKRLALYTHVAALVRAFADIASEVAEAGYSPAEIQALRTEVTHYENARGEVKQASGDAVDLKKHEPAMRHLIDTYIQAEDSKTVSAFDDLSLVQLIVERGTAAVDAMPEGIKKDTTAIAETIENNVRRLIIDEHPINPKYYEKMSQLLDALIEQRRQEALDYEEYLQKIVELTKQVVSSETSGGYPAAMNTPGRRALYDNLEGDSRLALAVDAAVRASRQDDWRSNPFKVKKVRNAIRAVLELAGTQTGAVGAGAGLGVARETPAAYVPGPPESLEERVDRIFALVKNQDEY
jgi:type I restriction enzyme R subunit